MICPFLSIRRGETCVEEECALWDKQMYRCSFRSLGKGVEPA